MPVCMLRACASTNPLLQSARNLTIQRRAVACVSFYLFLPVTLGHWLTFILSSTYRYFFVYKYFLNVLSMSDHSRQRHEWEDKMSCLHEASILGAVNVSRENKILVCINQGRKGEKQPQAHRVLIWSRFISCSHHSEFWSMQSCRDPGSFFWFCHSIRIPKPSTEPTRLG